MRLHPALDVAFPCAADDVLVAVDEFFPTALEERDGVALRLFFSSRDARDAACAALQASGYDTTVLDVDDEDWARRSQEGLEPVTVGRITILPAPSSRLPNPYSLVPTPYSLLPGPDDIALFIPPSMGFGTGHHATTRFCLAALQQIPVEGMFVLDVGTGSGVLALAASRLGAARVLGIDIDEDAIGSARENLTLNPDAPRVAFEVDDITKTANPDIVSGRADIVTANLTGALLTRMAPVLVRSVRQGGWLVLSGILTSERDTVVGAFGRAIDLVAESDDREWVGLTVKKR